MSEGKDEVKDVVVMNEGEPVGNGSIVPYDNFIQTAISQNADLDKLEKLIALKERVEKNEAKKAYVSAMAAFKANVPVIIKDKTNKQYGSKYSSIENLVNNANLELGKHGLSANWSLEQDGETIKITCTMTHELGHSESVTMQGPPDKSGSKNDLQKIKSTMTYLKLATFECITGIATSEANVNDDGNGVGAACEFILTEQKATLEKIIKDKNVNVGKFLAHMKCDEVATIEQGDYVKALNVLRLAKGDPK
ncbi:unnamed protein product [marine sediment metagenome]|uniref:Uncharacterized protein n=1 Tax=marine sediment metagenome TaxID=412755 RepID=X0YXN0_9ZZZZ